MLNDVTAKLIKILVCLVIIALPPALNAQTVNDAKSFKTEELDQLLAPIALYPDELLTTVLMAATYPLEVVQASRWRKEPANAKLSGEALTKALEPKDWDPSIKTLTQFPDVLHTMSDKLEWTQKLGDAFLAQQSDVMDRIQFLRKRADEAGSLKSNKQQKVTKQTNYIIIESASPQTVYVPVYQPAVVYGTWWYPAYPPYYWPPVYPGAAFVNGFFWGAGFAVANSLWGWGRCDWHRHDININVNKFNNININRAKITSSSWRHNPEHRRAVPYREKTSREKFGSADRVRRDASRDFRGFEDKKQIRDRAGATLKDGRPKISDGKGDTTLKDHPGKRSGERLKPDKARDMPAVRDKATRDVTRSPSKTREHGNAFKVKQGSQVTREANRGRTSRDVGGSRGGGGHMQRGGGGRRR